MKCGCFERSTRFNLSLPKRERTHTATGFDLNQQFFEHHHRQHLMSLPSGRRRRGKGRQQRRSMLCWLPVLLLALSGPTSSFLVPARQPAASWSRRSSTRVADASSSPPAPSSAGNPGYVPRRGRPGGSTRTATQRPRRPPPPPPPPPPRARLAAPTQQQQQQGQQEQGCEGGWVAAFERLQGVSTRTSADYHEAFAVCRDARRPFECFSLVRHMARDGLARPAGLYAETARLAADVGNWATVLDTYIVFERKEEFNGACPATRTLVELALQACDMLGKGSRALRVYERATQDLLPPLDPHVAAAPALRACFRAGLHELGLPFARALLSSSAGSGLTEIATLNMAVSTLAKAGAGNEAVAALEGLRAGHWGLKPDVVTYGGVIEGLLLQQQQQEGGEGRPQQQRGGGLEAAMALFEEMREQDGLEPNAVIKTMLAQACCRAGRTQDAWQLLQAIPERQRNLHRVRPLWALATREGHVDAIAWLLNDLERRVRSGGGTLAPPAYHAALCNLARLGLVEQAERLAAVVAAAAAGGKGQEAVGVEEGDGNVEETTPLPAVPTTVMTYYGLISACEKRGRHARLLAWFHAMLRERIEPDLVRYGMALQACERLGRWAAGRALVLSMRDRGLAVEPTHWKRLFLLLGREGRGQEALELLARLEGEGESLPVICYEAAVTALARAGDGAKAVAALVRFEEERGLPMGRGAYTSAIAACRPRSGSSSDGGGEGEQQGATAAVVVDADTALALYARMKTRAPELPSTVTRAALLDVLVAAKRLADAGAVAAEQEAAEAAGGAGNEPAPAHMLGNLVLAHAARQDFAAVLRRFVPLWKGRGDPSLPLPWGVCNAALQACAREGAAELAVEVLEVMRAAQASLDVVMYGCALTACAQAGQWRPAFRLLKEMEAAVDAQIEDGGGGGGGGEGGLAAAAPAVRPNLVCYTAVIKALQLGGEWRKALNLLLRMLSSPGEGPAAAPAPDTQTYNAVMSACANAGEAHMALRVFQAMRMQVGVNPDEVTYATAVVACWRVGDWRKAVELLQAMKADGFLPNMITVTLVIDACDRHRQFDLAAHVFESSVVGYIRSEDYEMGADGPGMVVDLHGYSQPVAKAAIRAGLKRLAQMWVSRGKDSRLIRDFVFITGVGRNSELPFEPVLRPAMQTMLTEDFNPPLRCEMVERNPGRMVIRAPDMVDWLEAQAAAKPSPTPAEVQGGTLRLRSAEQLETSYRDFLCAAAALAEADEDEERWRQQGLDGSGGDSIG